MKHAKRTFGWVQDAYDIYKLKNVVSIFVPGSKENIRIQNNVNRFVANENLKNRFLNELQHEYCESISLQNLPALVFPLGVLGRLHRSVAQEIGRASCRERV